MYEEEIRLDYVFNQAGAPMGWEYGIVVPKEAGAFRHAERDRSRSATMLRHLPSSPNGQIM